MKYRSFFAIAIVLTTAALAFSKDGLQQFASIGDLKLASGETILDCRIGYRSFGTLNADHSNLVVMTTWFTGTTGDLSELIGPGKPVDSSKY